MTEQPTCPLTKEIGAPPDRKRLNPTASPCSRTGSVAGDAAHDTLTDLLGLYDRLGGVDALTTTVAA